jgi:hypothetical protein
MEGKWLLLEKLIKYISGVEQGLLVNSRGKTNDFKKYVALCEYRKGILTSKNRASCI